MNIEPQLLQKIIESALMAYGQPLTVEKLQALFVDDKSADDDKSDNDASANELKASDDVENNTKEKNTNDNLPSKEAILEALNAIQESCEERGFELKKVSSGWRFQVNEEMAPWVNKLWEEKPQRYSRALLETLSIIAYRQPITRGDIEEIRGVAVSSHIIKTLTEREWIKVVGHRDVPGRPSLFATTRQFLDYFNLESLDELPSLRELADIDALTPELDLQSSDADSPEPQDSPELQNSPEQNELSAEQNNNGDELENESHDLPDNIVSLESKESDSSETEVEENEEKETSGNGVNH